LSRHLRTLEERSCATLIQRDTHRMHLTEAGQRLLDNARALLSLAEEADHSLHEARAVLRGHLRLFSTIELGQNPVTHLVARFLAMHPGVTVELGYRTVVYVYECVSRATDDEGVLVAPEDPGLPAVAHVRGAGLLALDAR
jgi:DNA-binding transcriptional LysR family regulator